MIKVLHKYKTCQSFSSNGIRVEDGDELLILSMHVPDTVGYSYQTAARRNPEHMTWNAEVVLDDGTRGEVVVYTNELIDPEAVTEVGVASHWNDALSTSIATVRTSYAESPALHQSEQTGTLDDLRVERAYTRSPFIPSQIMSVPAPTLTERINEAVRWSEEDMLF